MASPCPKCRGPLERIEKETFTGRDLRTYKCRSCGHTFDRDVGPAMWKAMEEAMEEEQDPKRDSPDPSK